MGGGSPAERQRDEREGELGAAAGCTCDGGQGVQWGRTLGEGDRGEQEVEEEMKRGERQKEGEGEALHSESNMYSSHNATGELDKAQSR